MGGTASRSAPMMCDVMPVPGYTKLVRTPHRLNVDKLLFRDLFWDVSVRPMSFDQDGLADHLVVSVVIDRWHGLRSAAGTHISIEILDETGKHTVFHEESSQGTMEEAYGYLILCVNRRELEASSCVFADSFTVRCTLKKMQQATKRRRLLGNLLRSNAVLKPLAPQVAMAGSHVLTIGSVSKLRAALRNAECIHSTHFAVGRSRWYLKFCPRWDLVYLVRASNGARCSLPPRRYHAGGDPGGRPSTHRICADSSTQRHAWLASSGPRKTSHSSYQESGRGSQDMSSVKMTTSDPAAEFMGSSQC